MSIREQLVVIHQEMHELKQESGRSEASRVLAIAATDLEKLIAWVALYEDHFWPDAEVDPE